MEQSTEQEGIQICLEDSEFPIKQGVQIKVSVEMFMHWSIPLPCPLVEISAIPIVKIKLPISKARQISIDIAGEFEKYKEATEILEHDWHVKLREQEVSTLVIIVEHA